MGVPSGRGEAVRQDSTWKLVALVVMAAVAWAGCTAGPLAPDPPAPLYAFAGPQSGFVSIGPTYDGSDVRPLVAGVLMNLTASDDEGQVHVAGSTDTGRRFALFVNDWNASVPHHQGGVAADAELHGDTGREGPELPFADAAYAAWSDMGFLFVEDLPYANPVPDRLFWQMEALYVPTGLHDRATGGILTTDGTPYDPADPAPAASSERTEIVVVLSSGVALNRTELIGPIVAPAGEAVPITSASYRAEHPFANPAWGADGVFEVEVSTPSGSLGATDLTFSLTAPSGLVLNSTQVGGGQAATAHATLKAPMDQLGVYSIDVEGQAAAVEYQVTASFASEGPIRIVLWWDDVSTDREAQQRAKQWYRLLDHQAGDDAPREPGQSVPNRVASSQPPGLDLFVVTLTVAVTLLAGLVVVKLVLDNVKGRRFDERFRRK